MSVTSHAVCLSKHGKCMQLCPALFILGNALSVGLCVEGLPPLLTGALCLRHCTTGLQGDDVLAS